MTPDELFALRDAMVERVGPSPEGWFADLDMDARAAHAVAVEVAGIAELVGLPVFASAGTSFLMGFTLGALCMREQLGEASS